MLSQEEVARQPHPERQEQETRLVLLASEEGLERHQQKVRLTLLDRLQVVQVAPARETRPVWKSVKTAVAQRPWRTELPREQAGEVMQKLQG